MEIWIYHLEKDVSFNSWNILIEKLKMKTGAMGGHGGQGAMQAYSSEVSPPHKIR
jgi:hypothetical protein